jgi:hypothetical protein
MLKELELKANHFKLEGLRPNMEEILRCAASKRICMHDMIWYEVH